MTYLLDTVVFLWGLNAPHHLNKTARQILENREEEIFLSPVASWEIAIKAGLGKLKLSMPVKDMIERAFTDFGARSLPIQHAHCLALAELPPLHNDPFDRMLAAQARSENMVLMTPNPMLERYPIDALWCGK